MRPASTIISPSGLRAVGEDPFWTASSTCAASLAGAISRVSVTSRSRLASVFGRRRARLEPSFTVVSRDGGLSHQQTRQDQQPENREAAEEKHVVVVKRDHQ